MLPAWAAPENSRSRPPQSNFGTASSEFPLEAARGKRIHFSGYIKTENVSGYARFWWRVDGASKTGPSPFANLKDLAPKGTTEWKQYELAQAFTALWFRVLPEPQKLSMEEGWRSLAGDPDSKAAQRISGGIPDYTIRADSCRQRTIGGLPALSCVADFTQGGQPVDEYLVWIRGENITALFFGRASPGEASPGEVDAFRERFERVIETAKIP